MSAYSRINTEDIDVLEQFRAHLFDFNREALIGYLRAVLALGGL